MNQAEKRLNDFEKGQKVLEIVRKFIQEHEVLSSECAYQSDSCLIAAPDLMCELMDAVDEYVKLDGDEWDGEYMIVPQETEPSSNGHYIGLDR